MRKKRGYLVDVGDCLSTPSTHQVDRMQVAQAFKHKQPSCFKNKQPACFCRRTHYVLQEHRVVCIKKERGRQRVKVTRWWSGHSKHLSLESITRCWCGHTKHLQTPNMPNQTSLRTPTISNLYFCTTRTQLSLQEDCLVLELTLVSMELDFSACRLHTC